MMDNKMRAVIVATWIGVAIVLSSVTGWAQVAQVCHSPRISSDRLLGNFRQRVVEDYIITKPIEAKEDGGYKFFYHPFGEHILETTSTRAGAVVFRDVKKTLGPVFEDCCNCGDNENTAYQLKIYSKDQDPTRGEKFDKPILITQGFDVNYLLSDEQFTFAKFQMLLDSVFHEIDGQHLPGEIGLLRQLFDEGYDVALLLWKNPNIDIRNNALVILQALRWLEGHTEPREGTEPVIIGPSMGGLATRYALQLAGEVFPESIRCRLLIAFDSPNRGAEVPMSLQALLSFASGDKHKAHVQFMNLRSMAARQMLLSSVQGGRSPINHTITAYEDSSTVHGHFMNEINDPVFRAQIKNITHSFAGRVAPIHTAAIINGSGMGLDLGLPADFTYASVGGLVQLRLDTPTPDRLTRVFEGIVPFRRVRYNFQEPAFMENTPGGLRSTYLETRNALRWNRFDHRFVNHSFIPSLSGAGLLDVDINNDRSWFANIDGTVKGMFDEARTPIQNQNHVAVTSENKEWFLELISTRGPQQKPKPVVPIVENVCRNEDRSHTATFGYNNPNAFEVTIPVGENNRFAGPGIQENMKQPETFLPRQHRAVGIRFGFKTGRGAPEWTLDGTTASAFFPPPLTVEPCPFSLTPVTPGGG